MPAFKYRIWTSKTHWNASRSLLLLKFENRRLFLSLTIEIYIEILIWAQCKNTHTNDVVLRLETAMVIRRHKDRGTLTQFVAEYSLSASMANHFIDLVKVMFPDSSIAKSFLCKRKNTTQIIKSCLATEVTKTIVERCKTGPFSIMINVMDNLKGDKWLAILVSCFESIPEFWRCHLQWRNQRILDVSLRGLDIPWQNVVGFASDNWLHLLPWKPVCVGGNEDAICIRGWFLCGYLFQLWSKCEERLWKSLKYLQMLGACIY